MNNDLISREALAWKYLELILNHLMDTDIFDFGLAVTNAIETAPAVDAVEVVHGRWVDHMVRDWRCSECGEEINKVRHVDGYCYDDKPNYCPNCGARMDGDT